MEVSVDGGWYIILVAGFVGWEWGFATFGLRVKGEGC